MVDVATLQALLATVPSEFVAARNELAKELRSSGDREGADAVKAMRRLGVADWALNVAARDQPDVAASFADAALDVVDAQEAAMAGQGGGDLRARLKALRARSAALVDAAADVAERHGQRGAGSSPLDLGARLAEVAGNRAAVDLLRQGLIGAADPGVADPFGLADGAGTERPPAKSAARTRRSAASGDTAGEAAGEAAGEMARGATDRANGTTERSAKRSPAPDDDARPNELERRRAERRARADAERAATAAAAQAAAAEAALAKRKAVAAKAAGRVAEAEARLAELVAAREQADAAVADAEEAHSRAVAEAQRTDAALSALS